MIGGGRLGGLILSGGASARMGQDKGGLVWGGRRAVDRLDELARAAGADEVLCVSETDYGLPQVREAVPQGGPVGGILAGVQALRAAGMNRALVLAADAPTLVADDLAPLLAAGGPGAAYLDLPLPLVAFVEAFPEAAPADWPLRRLLQVMGVARLAPAPEAVARLRGANTPAEHAALLEELEARASGV